MKPKPFFRCRRGMPNACCLEDAAKDQTTGKGVFQTRLIKIDSFDDKSHPQKILKGNFVIIGEHKGDLHLFNTENYQTVVISLSQW